MGNKHIQKNKTGLDDQTTLVKEYTPSFEKLKNDPQFFINLITENKVFTKNLFIVFPDSHLKFESYFEMVLFLRRQQAKFSTNTYAITNGPNTTLLDRFFMIVLGINYQEYEKKVMSVDELDQLLIHYFKLFLQNPQKGTIHKIMKFMSVEETSMKIKDFSGTLREYFPHVQKYLKDFYLLKFNKLEKDCLLLKQFKSKIINNDTVLLALKIPRMFNPEIVQLYNTQKYGLGFHSIQKRLVGYTGPWLLLIEHFEKNEKNQKQTYIMGAYQNGPIRTVLTHQGDVTGFMFAIHPTIKFMTTDKGEGGNHYFYINSIGQEKSKRRKGFGFGGNNQKKNFKLWIDQDLQKSSVFNGKDPTYGYGALASSGTERINIKRMQVWGLGSQHNIDDQVQYWKEREEEITKRRKVDKKQLLGNNAQLFFGNTFAHRDQVIGQIEKRKDDI